MSIEGGASHSTSSSGLFPPVFSARLRRSTEGRLKSTPCGAIGAGGSIVKGCDDDKFEESDMDDENNRCGYEFLR